MKKYVFAVLIAIIFITPGCFFDDDNYSLSDYWVGFGIFQITDANSHSFRIVMDSDDVLIPVSSGYHVHNYLEDGDRVLVKYTILDDDSSDGEDPTEYYIKLYSAKKILMKGILDITEENQDSIGNDPVIVQDVWLTDSLLNFEIKYWGNQKVHYINLVKQPGTLSETSQQPIELELRHNDNGDGENIPYTAFVSFQLGTLEVSGLDSIQFRVTSYDYNDEEFEFSGVYNYGENGN